MVWLDKYHLNFWTLDSSDFEYFKHPYRRSRMIKEYATEIVGYIHKFQDLAREEGI